MLKVAVGDTADLLSLHSMSQDESHVLCRVRESQFALRRTDVVEILPLVRLDRPAGSPRLLAGFMNLAGRPLAVLKLDLLLGEAPSGIEDLYSHIIRLREIPGRPATGLLVDRVLDAAVKAEGATPVRAEDSLNGCIAETLKIGERFVPRLAIEHLFLAEEIARLADMADAVAARLADWPTA